jgi:hypothetical protein
MSGPTLQEAKNSLTQDVTRSIGIPISNAVEQNGLTFPTGMSYAELEMSLEELGAAIVNNAFHPDQEITQIELERTTEQFNGIMAREFPQLPEDLVESLTETARTNAAQGVQQIVEEAQANGVDILDQTSERYRPEYEGDLPYQRKPLDGDMVRG